MDGDSELARTIRSIVQQTVREELQRFKDEEIAPLKRALDEVSRAQRAEHDFELPPAAYASAAPGQHQLSPSMAARQPSGQRLPLQPSPSAGSHSTTAPSSPNLLQRVSSKVASTTTSLLFNNPVSSGASSSINGSTGTAGGNGVGLGYGADVGVLAGPSSSNPSLAESRTSRAASVARQGPVTVRRNSGLSRATDVSDDRDLYDISIPQGLIEGLPFLRITHNKKVQRTLKLDDEAGVLSWNTKQSSRLSVDRICEIYVGEQARNYREEFRVSAEHSSRWATIIHQRSNDTKLRALHLIMANQSEFDSFIACLFRLVRYRRELMNGLSQAGKHFVDVHWTRSSTSAISNDHGKEEPKRLSFAQVMRLARQLHVNCSWHYIRQVFDEADADNSGFLDFQEFQEFVRLLKRRSDIRDIYEKHEIGQSTVNLVTFFENVQKQSLPSSVELPLERVPTLEEFSQMLMSVEDSSDTAVATESELSQPLSDYFISSSHNTYLTGRQVADGSSIESCIRALQDGCRCLELDCWDGASNSQSPVVYHGHGMTRLSGSILFSDVIDAILKYAFISSPYPLIISLEIRCGEASQLRIVSILRTVLAGLLVTDRLPGDDGSVLPSPEALKHRILIKVKASNASDSATSSEEGSSVSPSGLATPARKRRPRVVPALAELGVYLSGHHYNGGFPEHDPSNTVYSFNERTIKSMAAHEQKLRSLESHNKRYLTRVYPAPYRINSSNFDPVFFWKTGVQMVALNWQKCDLAMQLNSAFFPTRVGYVLKPSFMRSNTAPSSKVDSFSLKDQKLTVNIISAQQLPRPKNLKDTEPFSPYVVLEVLGIGPSSTSLTPQWRTPAVFDNGFNPIWNYECELRVEAKDLPFAFLRFSILSDDRPFAFYTCRVLTMLRGYRHLPLRDSLGEDFIFSSLFIKTELSHSH